ncbi:MAG: flagellar basal body rod protein FlgB [Planctomycetota bacterium]|jgi:flagellar basal-body rod protein FlgB
MMRMMFQQESIPVLDAALSFAHQRQKVIMNNIANVETPYYKRQALPEAEFQKALITAVEERRDHHPGSFFLEDTTNIDMEHGLYPRAQIDPGAEFGPERHDENSVVVEKEMADLAENSLYMETLQRLVKKKYTLLKSSLRDRV